MLRILLTSLILLAGAVPTGLEAQSDSVMQTRWVGRLPNGAPLFLEFYGDSMLVVNDRMALDYVMTSDSLIAYGDTTLQFRYRMSFGRMLLETPDGHVLTMSPQLTLARPLTGRWVATLETDSLRRMQLELFRGGGARWREIPGGAWHEGEWNRQSRIISFLWLPDSLTWTGQFDPRGNALLFSELDEGTGTVIFRKRYR